MVVAIACPSISIKKVSETVGLGAFTQSRVSASDILFEACPLVSIQHTANRRFVRACQNCHASIGSIRERFAVFFQEDRFENIDLGGLPHSEGSFVSCDCGESYCSVQCRIEAFERHHRFLCVVHSGDFAEAVSAFKFFCLSIDGCGDNLLLLAQLLATLASRAGGDYGLFQELISEILTLTNRPFSEVSRPPKGVLKDEGWQKWLESTIYEAYELLSRALSAQSYIFGRFFSEGLEAFMVFSRFLSVFELNNIDICIPSTLKMEVKELCTKECSIEPILRDKEVVMRALWNDEARGIYEEDGPCNEYEDYYDDMDSDEDHSEGGDCVEEILDHIRDDVARMTLSELLDADYPDFHGTGLYISVSRTNHSCIPNVSMDFDRNNSVVVCRALREMVPGEELRMSYISNPQQKDVLLRQSQLADYLFKCSCELCLQDFS